MVARRAPYLGALVLAAVAATPAPSLAQTPPDTGYPACVAAPTKAETDAAYDTYVAGRRSFDEGDYTTAITYFRDAYRRDCTKHDLLPIVARAYELNQDRAAAIAALETFLERVPPSEPSVPTIKKRIANLRAAEPPRSASAPAPTSAPPEADASGEGVADGPVMDVVGPSNAPWLVIGAGGVLSIVGTVMLVTGLGNRSEAVDKCPTFMEANRVCPEGVDAKQIKSQHDSGTSQAVLGGALLGAGVLAASGGVVWYFVDRARFRGTGSGTAVQPYATPLGGGVRVVF